jgi:LPS-assembly lipoprotein
MSSADTADRSLFPVSRIRRLAALACVAASGLFLCAACSDGTGFHPMNASAGFGGTGALERLAEVDIAPIPGRVGQRIRNELIYQSTGGGLPAPPKYRLEIAIRESVTSTLVNSEGNAFGQIYNLDAAYRLIRISDKAVVAQGRSYGRAGFERGAPTTTDSSRSIFANVRAREGAENRAAKTVADELKTRILAQLSRPA